MKKAMGIAAGLILLGAQSATATELNVFSDGFSLINDERSAGFYFSRGQRLSTSPEVWLGITRVESYQPSGDHISESEQLIDCTNRRTKVRLLRNLITGETFNTEDQNWTYAANAIDALDPALMMVNFVCDGNLNDQRDLVNPLIPKY
jgi:hypothetical protein